MAASGGPRNTIHLDYRPPLSKTETTKDAVLPLQDTPERLRCPVTHFLTLASFDNVLPFSSPPPRSARSFSLPYRHPPPQRPAVCDRHDERVTGTPVGRHRLRSLPRLACLPAAFSALGEPEVCLLLRRTAYMQAAHCRPSPCSLDMHAQCPCDLRVYIGCSVSVTRFLS